MAVMHARPIVVLLLILAGLWVSGPLRAQSLADVAKKEEERRKAVAKPAKVYTNKDLSAAAGGSGAPAVGHRRPVTCRCLEGRHGRGEGVKTEGKPDGPAKDQAYWSGRMKTIQDKLDRDQTYVEALQTRVNSLTADFVNRDDPAQRIVLERDRQKAIAELGRLQQEIVNGKKALADLEEEARRAGVPPGWLR